MKALKWIGGIIIGIALFISLLSLMAPNKVHVKRSIIIEKDKDFVHNYLIHYANFNEWSPWSEKDPNLDFKVENDGQIGAQYSWKGNEDVGEGSMKIIKISDDVINVDLSFVTPFGVSKSKSSYLLKGVENGTELTWTFESRSNAPFDIINLIIDFEEGIGNDYVIGLAQLKNVLEKIKPEANTMIIENSTLAERTYIAISDTVSFDDFEMFFANNFGKLYQAATAADIKMISKPSALMHTWDENNKKTYMSAAIMIETKADSLNGIEYISLPASNSLTTDYYGSYEGSPKAHENMWNYIQENQHELAGPVIEEYITDPTTEKDTAKWLTRIFYPIK